MKRLDWISAVDAFIASNTFTENTRLKEQLYET